MKKFRIVLSEKCDYIIEGKVLQVEENGQTIIYDSIHLNYNNIKAVVPSAALVMVFDEGI